jgi:hypothetical protein
MTRWLAVLALIAVPTAVQDEWTIVALRFDAKGTLYAADAGGCRIVAIETSEKAAKSKSVAIADLGAALAKAMNAKAGDVTVSALAVHPLSHVVYLAAARARGAATTLFRVSEKGDLVALAFKTLKTKTAALPKGHQPLDLVVGPKGLVVSSFAQEKQFVSRLHSIALPLADGAVGMSDSELYHTSHAAWETQAPLMAMTAFESEKKTYILGSTACTPVVRLDAADVVDKKKVKSATICELGMGNAPVSLAVYAKDKKNALLVTSEAGTYRIDGAVLTEGTKLDEKAVSRNNGEIAEVKVLESWKGVMKIALLDETSLVAVRKGAKLSLETLDLP